MFSKLLPVALAIVSSVKALTPEQLISAPRRSDAVPNPSGTLAVFSSSQYSFDTHNSSTEWDLLDLSSGEITFLSNDSDISEIVWLGDTSILYINGTNSDIDGGVELWISDVDDITNGNKVASIAGPVQGLKAVIAESGNINFLVWGESTSNGSLYNSELVATPYSSARIYDSIFVRHWDYYLTPEFQAVFSGVLTPVGNFSSYEFDGVLKNLVAPVKYAESPYPPFGGSSDYDLSPDGTKVVFMSKAPEVPKANFTTSYIFLVPHDGSSVAQPINAAYGDATPENARGASSVPVFSPDGSKVAYFQMDQNTYESDRNKLYVASIGDNSTEIVGIATNWDRSPDTVKWTPDGETFYLSVTHLGSEVLFSLPVDADADFKPQNFTGSGSVGAYYILPDSSVLVFATTVWTSAQYYITGPGNSTTNVLFSANEVDEELAGLGPDDIDEFYYQGNWTELQSWIVKPTGFSENTTYPLAFLIHGGPQGDWANGWSTRWNPKVWADQGYVVVLPNPTGSFGWGQELTDRIQNDWGGAPYNDLVRAWEYVRDNISYIDTANGIAAGASYGGYMTNWVQGNPLGREFKALVTHDGLFQAEARLSSEELWFIQHDFNGTLWSQRENFLAWDPAGEERILQFSTPHLVIHSDLDYRLPVAEGIALFNVLQERGVPSRFLNFPDEDHWVLNPENSLVWHQQVLGWINKYSGVGASNPGAVSLSDTTVEVVDIDAGPNN